MRKFLLTAFACLLTLGLTVHDAEAKRLGGGASRGIQRDSLSQRQTAPTQAAPQAPSAAPPSRPGWLGPLGGLAAGLGLGALLGHFGLGEGMADVLLIMLLATAAIVVLKRLFRRPQPQRPSDSMFFAGVGGPHMAPTPAAEHVEPTAGSGNATGPAASPLVRNIPADFDAEGFLRVAKANFMRLQLAHDSRNLDEIREFTSPEMFAEIKLDIDERGSASQLTEVLTLAAELLEVTDEPTRHLASVRFHGTIREAKDGRGLPFDEVWHLTKPSDGSRGWVLAGIQQLN